MQFIVRKGYPPTLRDIAERLGTCHQGAARSVDALIEKGYLERSGLRDRGLRVLRDTKGNPVTLKFTEATD
jgi:SOS-response transcriptional repressor LexA